jgi:hypothetical protein
MVAEAEDATRPVVNGTVLVDGSVFRIDRCISGSVSEVHGVDFVDAEGTKVRVYTEPNGNAAVVLFLRGADVGITMHGCAQMDVHDTGMALNRVKIVEGAASMKCASGDFTVEGTASFRCGP